MTCTGKTGFKYYPKNVADLKKKQRAYKKDIKARRKKKK